MGGGGGGVVLAASEREMLNLQLSDFEQTVRLTGLRRQIGWRGRFIRQFERNCRFWVIIALMRLGIVVALMAWLLISITIRVLQMAHIRCDTSDHQRNHT